MTAWRRWASAWVFHFSGGAELPLNPHCRRYLPRIRRTRPHPFFAGEISTQEDLSRASDSVADGATAELSRRLRGRYADLPQLLRDSTSAEDFLATLDFAPVADADIVPLVDTIIAHALNALP